MNTKKQNSSNKPTKTITPYQANTGAKYPEFAVFYNIAFFRIAGLVHDLCGKPPEQDKQQLENGFKSWIGDKTQQKDKILLKLKNYLWKGYLKDKNSSGTELEEQDKTLVIQFLQKLQGIRDFHSHYYHKNDILAFDEDLKICIEKLYEVAKQEQSEKYLKELDEFEKDKKREPLFKTFDGKHFITKEGRNFFLSFFLTQGEMARFLQQRTGFKRNDKPEYKIKHLIYRHYTHRDGSARHHYGQQENVLSSLPQAQQKEIMAFRSAVKLVSYLNDVPQNLYDIDLFPLFLKSGEAVLNAQTLEAFCQENNLFDRLGIKPLEREVKVEKKDKSFEYQIKIFDQVLELRLADSSNYKFEIGRRHFQQLVLLCLNGFRTEEFILQKLKFFVQERQTLLEILDGKRPENENGKITLNQDLDEYYRYKLRGTDYLRKRMGAWLDSLERRQGERKEFNTFKEKIETEPIVLGFYDFFFEEDEKPRQKNQFMAFAVHYLIDSQKVKDWHWAWENFKITNETKTERKYGEEITRTFAVNKRQIVYSPTQPKRSTEEETEFRLAFTPDDQILLATYPQKISQKPKLFLLGHRAMKNLLIACFEKKDINSFFYKIADDLNNLDKPKFLDKNSLPTSLRKNDNADIENLKARAEKRIEYLEQELNFDAIKNRSRADKNRQIMRCYLFWDWKYEDQNKFKFLRQDEYKRLSIYHYLLEKRIGEKYDALLEGIEEHLPPEIAQMLKKATDLDDLLEIVIKASIELLKGWKELLPILKRKQATEILAKIGISAGKEPHFDAHIPFDIHPILPVKCFYGNELTVGKFSLSKNWWNDEEKKKALRPDLYNYQNYLAEFLPKKMVDIADTKGKTRQQDFGKRTQNAVIGSFNELLAQETLLWKMAQWYFENTSTTYRQFLAQHENDWKVSNLRKSPCLMDLGDITIDLEFHQLDDYLLVESKHIIEQAAKQVVRRFERGEYVTQKEIKVKKIEKKYELPYEEVFREIQRVHNQSVHWAKYILAWEEKIVERHKHLIDNKDFIDFKDVCRWARLDTEITTTLIKLRNTVFHAAIPADFTYQEMEENETLVKLLNYQKKQKPNYEI